jgi:hypothetical protein
MSNCVTRSLPLNRRMVEVESCQAQLLGRRKQRLLLLVFETKMPLPGTRQAFAKYLEETLCKQ